ncbi:hypothetical protein Gpo141_00013719 [Globisporangium polare]
MDFSVPSDAAASALDAVEIAKWQAFSEAQQDQTARKLQMLEGTEVPKMTICMATLGSWDQNLKHFVALGMRLAKDGHRVRVAAHEKYRRRITERGLEFYPIGGTVKGLHDFIKYLHDAKETSIFKRHKAKRSVLAELRETTFSLWGAAVSPDPHGSGVDAPGEQFRADALICHPMMFGHVYVAQRLGIPLHCLSLVPMTPTYKFPHVLSSYFNNYSPELHWEPRETNWLSYGVVDAILWQGIVDVLNEFRVHIGLPGKCSRPILLVDWCVPHTYCWNPAVLQAPIDWGSEISIAGWFTLDDELERKKMRAHKALRSFNDFVLETGNPVIYFGVSNVWTNQHEALHALLTKIDTAAQQANVRVVFQKEKPDDSDIMDDKEPTSSMSSTGCNGVCYQSDQVYEIESDFAYTLILRKVAAVIHWGNPGMIAEGLAAGKPTCICPQLSTQYFGSSVCVKAGVGVRPVDLKTCSSDELAATFRALLAEDIGARVKAIAGTFSSEAALENAVESFYSNLPLPAMVCDVDKSKLARVYDPHYDLKLSFEAYVAIRNLQEYDGADDVSYRPLLYDGKGPPKYSLRGIRGEIRPDEQPKRVICDAVSAFAVRGMNFQQQQQQQDQGEATARASAARTLSRTMSLLPIVEERPRFWRTHQEEKESRERIHAAYERALCCKKRMELEKRQQQSEEEEGRASDPVVCSDGLLLSY